MRSRVLFTVAAGALAWLPWSAAQAGSAPYYGYSPYFGGAETYYTPSDDVQLSSTRSAGQPGFGTRVYATGGPFWHRRNEARTLASPRSERRRLALRRRG